MKTRTKSTTIASFSLSSLLALSAFAVACDDGPSTADFPASAGQGGSGGTNVAGSGGTSAGGTEQAGGASNGKGGSGGTGIAGATSTAGAGGGGGTGPSKGGSGGSGGSGIAGAGGSGVGGTSSSGICKVGDPTGCGKGEFCQDNTKTCGQSGKPGTCTQLPNACPDFCQSPGVCGCDGQRYCNNCEAAAKGVSLANDKFCGDVPPDPPRACGTKGTAACFKGEFCDRSDAMTCGEADEPGVCKVRPTGKSCSKQCENPGVCGCDGQRYCNECQAEAKGVSVAPSDSYCKPVGPPVRACGSKGTMPCFDGEFCDRSAGKTCGESDEPGVCKPLPDVCSKQCQDPGVCGCDGQRYCSACAANLAGVSAAPLDSYCPSTPPAKVCGGFVGATCAQNEYCLYPADAGCGLADGQGSCVAKETKCDTVCTTPICGCDGQYYCNECALSQNGVSAAPDASYCKK
jgi:hypothetical protein